ncbi:MAG: hypothetical protein WD740_04270 [Anaerolineales bacterium]
MPSHSAQDPEENLPDWLRALRNRQNQGQGDDPEAKKPPVEPSAPSEQSIPAQEPNWLGEIRSRYRREKPSAASEEPDLGDTKPHRVKAVEDSPPEDEKATPAFEERPAVVEDTSAIANETPFEPEASPFPEQEPGIYEDSLQSNQAEVFNENQEAIDPGVLPSWLQALRPGGSFPTEDARSGAMLPGGEEASGPLAGLSDVLPADPGLPRIEKPPAFSPHLEVSENQGLHAAAFTKQLAEMEPPPVDEAGRVARPNRVLNLVIAAVIFLAVLFPLATQSRIAVRPDPQLFPEATNIHTRVDAVPAGTPVLVAFEVQPGLYGEMAPLVTAILDHLLDRQAHLVFVSTRPTGPALAERVLAEQFSANPAVATGAYSQLGYLSGGLAALRGFISDPRGATLSTTSGSPDPWQNASLDPIQQLNNFSLVVVVSSSADDGRAWIEQSAGLLPNGLIAVTSAQAAPLLRAYLQSDPLTLQGLVSGVQGAALYERLRTEDNGLGRVYWDAYSYGIGAIVLLVLLGGLYGRLIRIKPEKTSTAGSKIGT